MSTRTRGHGQRAGVKNATWEHFQEFQRVHYEIAALTPKLQAQALGAKVVMDYNVAAGNLDGSLLAGMSAMDHLLGELERLMGAFKAATANFLGERPKIGEADMDFVARICSAGVGEWCRMAERNGIRLNLG